MKEKPATSIDIMSDQSYQVLSFDPNTGTFSEETATPTVLHAKIANGEEIYGAGTSEEHRAKQKRQSFFRGIGSLSLIPHITAERVSISLPVSTRHKTVKRRR